MLGDGFILILFLWKHCLTLSQAPGGAALVNLLHIFVNSVRGWAGGGGSGFRKAPITHRPHGAV